MGNSCSGQYCISMHYGVVMRKNSDVLRDMYTAQDVADILSLPLPKAYYVLSKLNDILICEGKLIRPGYMSLMAFKRLEAEGRIVLNGKVLKARYENYKK